MGQDDPQDANAPLSDDDLQVIERLQEVAAAYRPHAELKSILELVEPVGDISDDDRLPGAMFLALLEKH